MRSWCSWVRDGRSRGEHGGHGEFQVRGKALDTWYVVCGERHCRFWAQACSAVPLVGDSPVRSVSCFVAPCITSHSCQCALHFATPGIPSSAAHGRPLDTCQPFLCHSLHSYSLNVHLTLHFQEPPAVPLMGGLLGQDGAPHHRWRRHPAHALAL